MRNMRIVARKASSSDLGHYSDPPLLVLASLADGSKHGYAMIEDIFQVCGTRLNQEGLIEALKPKDRRQPYRLTIGGRRVLRAKLATLRQFSLAGLKKLKAR
jgi:DNA-binding PadR family transcriptional regulator